MTLDNLRSSDLLALCKLLNVSSIGTDTFMRFMLRARLESLLKDDMVSFKCQIIITSVSLLLKTTVAYKGRISYCLLSQIPPNLR